MLGLAIALGAGTMIGGLMGGKANANAQDRANIMNYRMNQENNALQRELANQKYDKDLEQWHRQNAYNSPLAQANRYREAGINPYLADISGGQATSSPEMALAQTQAGRVEPVSSGYIGDSLQAGIGSFASIYQTLENTKSVSIDNQTKGIENLLKLEEVKERLKSSKVSREFVKKQSDIYNKVQDSIIAQNKAHTNLLIEQEKGQVIQNNINSEVLKFLPEQQQLQRLDSLATIHLKYKQGILTEAQAMHEAKKMAETDSRTALNHSQIRVNQSVINANNAQAGLADEHANTVMYDRQQKQILEKYYQEIVKFGSMNSAPNGAQRYRWETHYDLNSDDPLLRTGATAFEFVDAAGNIIRGR